uniref:Vps16 C-terminal domain-containing protein n=2 Tax=Corethron hystrix TaxID=216773 RepID=A0A7S1BW54_9STRA|mmetsp:Transcript_43350/g.101693  ORF Transcript_43350/g.101693 Transcript_43350/m.101693 type:complete len:309 (+) Transcript_43350:569-1495(+)
MFLSLQELERHCLDSADMPTSTASKKATTDALAAAEATFLRIVTTQFPAEVRAILRTYYDTRADPSAIVALLCRENRLGEAGAAIARRALAPGVSQRERRLMLRESSRIMNQGKDTLFLKTCTDEYLELVAEQERLRTEVFRSSAVAPEGSSAAATLASIVRHAASMTRPNEVTRINIEAEKFAKRFRLHEKLVWSTKVRALAETGQWEALRALGDARGKNPIGFKPFATAAITGMRPSAEILRYIDRVTIPEERFELLCQAQLWSQAIQVASTMKEEDELIRRIYSTCGSPDVQNQCEKILINLRNK